MLSESIESKIAQPSEPVPIRSQASPTRPLLYCGLVTVALLLIQIIWFSQDKRTPSTDEAGHILNAMQYTQLLHHFHPWQMSWLHQFLSINQFYPPAVYIYDGFLRLLLGSARWVDNVCFLSYFAVLIASTYGIAFKVSQSTKVAALAAATIFFYPQIQFLSHVYMLDLPLVAMIALALFSLIWWQERPNAVRTIAAGVAVALCCFTKQLGAAYLIPPCLLLLTTMNWRAKGKLIWIGAITSAVMIPWLLTNAAWIKSYAAENAAGMQGAQMPAWTVFGDYFVGLAFSMSFALTAAFLIACAALPKATHAKVVPLYASAIGGLALTSLLTCTFALDRYAAPALILTAVVTACGAQQIWRRNKPVAVLFTTLLLLVGTVQVLGFSFNLGTTNGIALREFRGARTPQSRPQDDSGWQQSFVVKTIKDYDGAAPVWLNILPSDGIFNPHSFELLAAETGSALKPTTSRRWTIMGDTVQFDSTSALWYHWYLLKTGSQGNRFKDPESKDNYEKLTRFIQTSGNFKQVAVRTLPDKSTLYLYRQR